MRSVSRIDEFDCSKIWFYITKGLRDIQISLTNIMIKSFTKRKEIVFELKITKKWIYRSFMFMCY